MSFSSFIRGKISLLQYLHEREAIKILWHLMDNLHVRLNLDLGKENKIYRHSSKEHLKIAMFGWQNAKS